MTLRLALPLVFSFLAAACSVGGEWPSLGDALPDPAARTTPYADPAARPHKIAPPAPGDAVAEGLPDSSEAAAGRYLEVDAAFNAAFAAYAEARDSIAAAPDRDIAGDRWREAQLLLTRTSFVRERLIPLLEMNEAAAALFAASDDLIAAERQTLTRLKP